MHLSEIKQRFPKAYAAYIELLVEDCPDDFEVVDGVLTVKTQPTEPGVEGRRLHWDETKTTCMDIGAGWENEEDDPDEV